MRFREATYKSVGYMNSISFLIVLVLLMLATPEDIHAKEETAERGWMTDFFDDFDTFNDDNWQDQKV